MNARYTKISRFFGIGALTLTLLGAASCGEDDGSGGGGLLDDALKQCGLTCSDTGVLEGNASITGYVAVDTFFQSVVNFKGVANTVAGDIKAELAGIQASFGITAADLKANANLAAAIKAKYDAEFVVKAQPAKCEIDASLSVQAQAECNVKAGCTVDEGKLAVQCMGTCSAEVNAEGGCDADASVTCNVTAPSFACEGTCEGSCNVELAANGSCDGECSVAVGADGRCNGTCTAAVDASGKCSGTCNGTCKYEKGSADCDARATVSCDFKAEAKAECKGSCEGDFEPPKVDCDADASCKASAKADAKFQAKCTPPSVTVELTVGATGDLRTQFDYGMADLKNRLPRLLAATAKADLVTDAGATLAADGKAAVKGSLEALGSGDVDIVAKYRIATCAPKELDDSTKAITDASTNLNAQLKAAADFQREFGM